MVPRIAFSQNRISFIMISSSKRDQLISEQRKKLQQLRLQSDSENTKLLKIQQKQREVEAQYQRKKQDMHHIMATLAKESEQFLNEQNNTAKEFDSQKEQIYSNDKKKEMYLKLREQIKKSNEEKSLKIKEKKAILADLNLELETLRHNISQYRIYYQFLKDLQELSEEFSASQSDQQGVMQIIYRYQTLETKRAELVQEHRRIENSKDEKQKIIQQLKSENEDKILSYNSKIKALKEKIDQINEQNITLQSDIEGKLNEDNERLTEIGQVIFSIQNLYEGMVGDGKTSNNLFYMLNYIKDQKKRLKDIMELYQHADQKKK